MEPPESRTIWQESKTDLKFSFHLFRQNFRPFFYTYLFSIAATATIIVGIALFWDLFEPDSLSFLLFFLLAFALIVLITEVFMTCQYGLAFDVISSGDMFAEFKGAFTYFRRFWWQYLLLALLIGIVDIFVTPPSIIIQISDEEVDVASLLEIFSPWGLLDVVIFFLFINTFPSVTAQGSFRGAFVENFRILRHNAKRMVVSWGLFFLIFFLPQEIAGLIVAQNLATLAGTRLLSVLLTILPLYSLVIAFIRFPVMTLIATRIYNTVQFTPYKPHRMEVIKVETEESRDG